MVQLASLALLLSLSQVKAAVPDQPVLIMLDLKAFKASKEPDAKNALLFGDLDKGAILSVLYEENAPFITSQECAEQRKHSQTFTVGDVICVESSEKVHGVFETTTFHAFPVTPDYSFDIHVTYVSMPGHAKARFTREDFSAIVKSFKVEGRADSSKLAFPPAYYTFRDEAAKKASDQLEWVTGQCRERADDAIAHFYRGNLLYQHDKDDLAVIEYSTVSKLLEQRTDRTEKETLVLLHCLDRVALSLGRKKQYAAAIPFCQRIVAATEKLDTARAKGFRMEALYNLAICHAQTKANKEALVFLRQVIALEPRFKKRAADDELLAPLRSSPEFARLTKS